MILISDTVQYIFNKKYPKVTHSLGWDTESSRIISDTCLTGTHTKRQMIIRRMTNGRNTKHRITKRQK